MEKTNWENKHVENGYDNFQFVEISVDIQKFPAGPVRPRMNRFSHNLDLAIL